MLTNACNISLLPMTDEPQKRNRSKGETIRYLGLGFEILATMCLFVGGGYALDQWTETEKPWYTLGLSLIGCGVAIYLMIRVILKKDKS